MRSWFTGLSSATKTRHAAVPRRAPAGVQMAPLGSGGFASRPAAHRIVKENVLPWPGVLVSDIEPPIIFTRLEQIVKPRPVPPYFRVTDPSAWRNGSKI